MEINLKNEKRLFIDLGNNVEMSIIENSKGEITLSVDNATMLVAPKSSNSIGIVVGAQLGAIVNKKMDAKHLKPLAAFMIVIIALRMIYFAVVGN